MLFGTLTIQTTGDARDVVIDVQGLRYLVDGSDNAMAQELRQLAERRTPIIVVGAHMSNDLSAVQGSFPGGLLEIYKFCPSDVRYDASGQRWLTTEGLPFVDTSLVENHA